MADDILSIGTTADAAAGSSGSRVGTALDTGVLRRKYNFGDRVSELNIAQDPFFRFVSKLAKKPTDDPSFKFTERRPSFHKRYAYLFGATDNGTLAAEDAAITANTTALFMSGDYKSAGNISNVYGQTNGEFLIGSTGTRPQFFLPGQIVKVPTCATAVGNAVNDYALYKVTAVAEATGAGSEELIKLTVSEVKAPSAYFQSYKNSEDDGEANISQVELEAWRSYVVGTAYDPGTGFPQTWDDQPFSTAYGQTQIWKTSMAMNNTDRATMLKYEANEWARVWKEKLIEHKWDIETGLLFGTQSSSFGTTEGAVNFITKYGNVFSLDLATKTQDDFLDDMSAFLDPRYNSANATLFFVNTATYNWLHKLSGYFSNNLESSPNFRADMALTGKKKVFGVDITTISTPYGDMNVARNIHLDSTSYKILAINMKHCAYRPLVGNGLNRDTAVYVGVQTLENTGVDRRVDLIQTEAGMEWQMPESHAYWS